MIQSTFSGLDRLARNSFAGGVGRAVNLRLDGWFETHHLALIFFRLYSTILRH